MFMFSCEKLWWWGMKTLHYPGAWWGAARVGGGRIFFPEPLGLCTVALLAAIYSPNLGKFSNFSPQRFREKNFAGGGGGQCNPLIPVPSQCFLTVTSSVCSWVEEGGGGGGADVPCSQFVSVPGCLVLGIGFHCHEDNMSTYRLALAEP